MQHGRTEEEYWTQKVRCLWLKNGGKNTNFFHKQAKGRKNYKVVKEIQSQGKMTRDFEEIKKVVYDHF